MSVQDQNKINGILEISDGLLADGTVEVVIEDDKEKKVFHVKEPSIKNKKKFNEALEKFAKKKKGKK